MPSRPVDAYTDYVNKQSEGVTVGAMAKHLGKTRDTYSNVKRSLETRVQRGELRFDGTRWLPLDDRQGTSTREAI